MNVLFLDQFAELGGAQRVLLDTIAAAQAQGWNAWAALPSFGPLTDQLRSRNVTVVRIPCGPYRSGSKGLTDLLRFAFDLPRQVRTIRNIKQTTFDLFYVNGPRLLPAAALAVRSPARVLFHAHSHVDQEFARTLATWAIRHARASVVACSKSVMEPLRKSVALENQSVVPNGVEDIPYREREFAPGQTWRIGLIGRISPEKGQAEFVRAAALLHPQFPNAQFLICGAPLFSDSSYLNHVQELARGLPVQFLGWRDDVATVLSQFDLLAVPSQNEGMGRVIIEAYSAGVPVVAFATGGIPEIVSNGDTGFLVQEPTPEALARRVRDAIQSDPAQLRRIAANARRRYEQQYTVRTYQDRIIQVMQRAVTAAATTASGG